MLKQYKLRNYHFQLVISILVLNIIGILIIGSAKHSVQKMQILGCIIGMVAMVIVSLMDYSFILRFTWLYYIGIIVLLGLVMTGIGDSAGGAQRWIDFGGFRFQPSELAKIVLILFFARFFSKHAENLNTVKTIGLSFVLIGIPLLLIVKQPDTSTSIAIALIFISLLFINRFGNLYSDRIDRNYRYTSYGTILGRLPFRSNYGMVISTGPQMVGYRSTAAKFDYGNWIRPVMGERSEQFRGHIHEKCELYH